MKNKVTVSLLKKIYELKDVKKKSWKQISTELKRTVASLRHIYNRTFWDEFLQKPDEYLDKMSRPQKWTEEDMIRLYTFLQSGKSYNFIAEKMNRSICSVESRAKETDWKAWQAIRDNRKTIAVEEGQDNVSSSSLMDQYIEALLQIGRYEYDRIRKIKEQEFLLRVNLEKDKLLISFDDLRERALKRLIDAGYGNPETVEYGEGTYVVVGDSHGKHTKKSMFAMLNNVNKYIRPKKIIHIGHILDDDNDISYDWENFSNLTILTKVEELKIIQEQRNKFKFHYDIIRESIALGENLYIFNQDIISDYVKTPISTVDPELFADKSIFNCHRLEFHTRCTNETASYFASPGCLCERHIIKTIKQIDFEDGKMIKQAWWDGFSKYRRMNHTNKYWEQGMLIINVDRNGKHTIIPCAIKMHNNGFATSYFDKIISSDGIFEPDRKIFVNGDIHSDKHDCKVLDVQEQICKDYKPNTFVSIGDTHNYSALNHHILDRGGVILNKKILQEAAQTNYVLRKMEKWAKENYLICGNHERFAEDFIEKFPQFAEYLNFSFLCGVKDLSYKLIDLKDVLKINSAKFIHGEIKMYGQKGNKLEKASRTFGSDIFIGHIHSPGIRFGCYSVGLTGELDQDYNESEASNWLHGFGLCNQYKGKSWLTTIPIIDGQCIIKNKHYSFKNPDSWKMHKYDACISYRVK